MTTVEMQEPLSSFEAPYFRWDEPVESAQEVLNYVEGLADPREQALSVSILALHSDHFSRHRLDESPETQAQLTGLFEGLVRFAADPQASESLFARAQAFEIAARILSVDVKPPEAGGSESQLAVYRQRLESQIPRYFDQRFYDQVNRYGNFSLMKEYGFTYDATTHLLEQEGLEWFDVFENPHDFGDPETVVDKKPLAAFMLSEHVMKSEHIGNYGRVTGGVYRDILEATLQGAGRILDDDLDMMAVEGKLADDPLGSAQLKMARASNFKRRPGWQQHEAEYTRALMESPAAGRFLDELQSAYKHLDKLQDIFPESYRGLVRYGAGTLAAEGTYGMLQHIKNGMFTEDAIRLKSGFELPVTLIGDEPIEHMRALGRSAWLLHEFFDRDSVRSVPVVKGSGFHVWRLIDLEHDLPPVAGVHLRPYGSPNYDPRFEHGRPGEGVEATIGLNVDPTVEDGIAQPIRLGKRAYNGEVDNRVSIRLDREGEENLPFQVYGPARPFRDPTIEFGKASLDVASVLGNDGNLGTRIGRFLAWSSGIRARQHNEEEGLNHMTHPVGAQEFGEADRFAAAVQRMDDRLRGMQATPAELRHFARTYAGPAAVAVSSQLETV